MKSLETGRRNLAIVRVGGSMPKKSEIDIPLSIFLSVFWYRYHDVVTKFGNFVPLLGGKNDNFLDKHFYDNAVRAICCIFFWGGGEGRRPLVPLLLLGPPFLPKYSFRVHHPVKRGWPASPCKCNGLWLHSRTALISAKILTLTPPVFFVAEACSEVGIWKP
jgi:hypothetical protein